MKSRIPPPKVYLRAVRIEGFRSCESTLFEPNQSLSVLIGPNGSGKTSILRAITLLGTLTGVRLFFSRKAEASDSSVSQFRILAEFQIGRNLVALRSTISYVVDDDNNESVVDVRDEWRIGGIGRPSRPPKDWAYLPIELLLSNGLPSEDLVLIRRSRRLQREVPILMAPTRIPLRLRKLAVRVTAFRRHIGYYSASQFTNPARCPSSFEIDDEKDSVRPSSSRNEHQRFLLDLYRLRVASPDKYSSYISLVGQQGLRLISDISWKEVKVASSQVEVRTGGKVVKRKRRRLLVVPRVRIGTDRVSFGQLSEGTFRTLALVFYLITDTSELLLIEEPEVCVHHGLLASIVELIRGQSAAKQIIFSTHSDFVLDQVNPDNVFSTTMSSRNGTAIRSLATGYPQQTVEALRDFLRTSGNLGEFWRQGGFDH